jgi:hypothetical protein
MITCLRGVVFYGPVLWCGAGQGTLRCSIVK